MIDARRLHTLAGVARQEKRVAKGEITLVPRVAGHLHAEQVDIKVAGFAIVGHLVGDMVDGEGFEAFALRRGMSAAGHGGGGGDALDELAAVHAALLEIVEKFRDEVFHGSLPFLATQAMGLRYFSSSWIWRTA